LDLSANLHLRQYFAPNSWAQNNASDLDMSMAPTLLANGQVVVSGKTRIIYLLNGAHLGGIGHEESSLASGCSQDIDGGPAVVGTVVFLPCLSGPIAVRVSASPPALHVLWASSAGGGPPIVTAGEVWTIGTDGVLYGLNQLTGEVRQRATIGVTANHFPTPSVGGGLLLVATSTHVVAFATR
jgi:outer membrane protein assembly factor BamB